MCKLILLSSMVIGTLAVEHCTQDCVPEDAEAGTMLLQSNMEFTHAHTDTPKPITYGHPAWVESCKSIYLDVGSNIGVQVRKLYEPEKFPDAAILSFFTETYGPPSFRRLPANESGVCALGFEPNPIHTGKLDAITQAYQKRGWNVHFYPYAAWKEEGTTAFDIDPSSELSDWGARMSTLEFDVRTIDLSAFIQTLPATSVKFMKMDIEGAEYETVARLLEKSVLCAGGVDRGCFEAHEQGVADAHSLWTRGFNFTAISDAVAEAPCQNSTPTAVIALDDESYLFGIDDIIGEPPYEPNQTALDLYRQNPAWISHLPKSQRGGAASQ